MVFLVEISWNITPRWPTTSNYHINLGAKIASHLVVRAGNEGKLDYAQ